MKSPKSLAARSRSLVRGPRRTAESKASLAQLERYPWRTWKEPPGSVLGSRTAWPDRAWQSPCCTDGKIECRKVCSLLKVTQHEVPGSDPIAFLSAQGKRLFFSDHRIQSLQGLPLLFMSSPSEFRRGDYTRAEPQIIRRAWREHSLQEIGGIANSENGCV